MIQQTMEAVVETQCFKKKPLYIFQDTQQQPGPELSKDFASCRICLEECPNIQYCQCFGGMLCHQECLIQYIEKISVTDQTRVHKCEICKEIYRLKYEVKCTFQPKEMCRRICEAKTKCIVYLLFFLLVLTYYITFSILYADHQITESLQSIIYVIGICITLLLFFFMFVWLYEFGISSKRRLIKILTHEQQEQMIRERRKSLNSKRKENIVTITPCDNSTFSLN